jgi:class 3 adenylate cyclase
VSEQNCAQCEVSLVGDARFCHRCGRSTRRLPQVERRWCSVLFADVRNFTTLCEGMDPEIVQHLMNTLFGRLGALVESHGGSVDKIIGDAIMALFGVPKASGDDAESAVRCGLAIHSVCAAVAEELGLGLQMRVGINTGEVIAGSLGRASEYTVIGDMVNVAARLESASKPGQVLVGSATAQQVRQRYELTPVGELHLKGRAAPEAAFLVLGESKGGREPAGNALPMVGREEQFETLLNLHRQEGCASAILTSEPGGGRGRVAHALSEALKNGFTLTLESHADPHPGELPLRLLSKLAVGVDAPHVLAADLQNWLGEGSAALTILDHLSSEEPWDEAQAMWQFVIDHEQFPSLLIVDEAQRLDARSSSWLRAFLEWRGQGLVLLNAQQDELLRERLGEALGSTTPTIDLPALNQAQVKQWLAAALGTVEDQLAQRFHETSGGNPSHMNELLRVWRNEQVIHEDHEVWVLDVDRIAEVQVPGSLRELMQARIDALPRTPRYLLQRCAAVGRVFWQPVAVEIAIGDEEEVLAALSYLVKNAWLEQFVDPQLPKTTAYRFRGTMISEVASRMLPLSLRRNIHGKVAAWLEESSAELSTGLRLVLARHMMLARSEEDASALYEKLASEALLDGDAGSAAEALAQAAHGAMGSRRASLQLDRAELLWLRSAQVDEAAAALRNLLTSSNLPLALQLRANCVLAQVELEAGRPGQASRSLAEAEARTEEIHDAVVLAYIRLTRAEIDQLRGGWQRAEQVLDMLCQGDGLADWAVQQVEILRARRLVHDGDAFGAVVVLQAAARNMGGDASHRLELLVEQVRCALEAHYIEGAEQAMAQAEQLLEPAASLWFEIKVGLLAALVQHEKHDARASKAQFEKALTAADEAGMKRIAWEALVWRLNRSVERGEEGCDLLASAILERSTGPWTQTGRALAMAVSSLAERDLDLAREAERLASLPGPAIWRRTALTALASIGALFDVELQRRSQRLALALRTEGS